MASVLFSSLCPCFWSSSSQCALRAYRNTASHQRGKWRAPPLPPALLYLPLVRSTTEYYTYVLCSIVASYSVILVARISCHTTTATSASATVTTTFVHFLQVVVSTGITTSLVTASAHFNYLLTVPSSISTNLPLPMLSTRTVILFDSPLGFPRPSACRRHQHNIIVIVADEALLKETHTPPTPPR